MVLMLIFICILRPIIANNLFDVNNTIVLPCAPFKNFDNGEVLVDPTGSLHLVCNDGFDLFGASEIVCVDGMLQEQPKCEARCKKPPIIHNGGVVVDLAPGTDNMYKKGALANYNCNIGFTLTPPDSKYRVCELGIWTGANATCVPQFQAKCKVVDGIKYGRIIHEKLGDTGTFLSGQTIEYVCNSGYVLKGEPQQRCLDNGTWAPRVQPTCVRSETVPRRCISSPIYPNSYSKVIAGYHSFDSAEDGTIVEVTCLPKYRNTMAPCETAKLRCVQGQWLGIPPNCELVTECRCPPKVPLGTPFLITASSFDIEKTCRYPINTTISYICVAGYELVGYRMLTCTIGGCWDPIDPPICKIKQGFFYQENTSGEPIVFSLATGAGVLILLVVACLIIVCRKRKTLSRAVTIPPPVPRADLADHATLLHPPDRLALIAFADGIQVGQSGLPTYEEATRDRNLGITSSRLQRPPWPSIVSRRTRNSPNPENILFTRQGSFASHSASTRSGGDPMGSTDTMAVSENSTTVTLDTASSHSGSQPGSCRAHCGSLASFDTSSVLNTEGVPLLEESELEEIHCGDTVSLAMENRSMCDNSSYKLSTASDVA